MYVRHPSTSGKQATGNAKLYRVQQSGHQSIDIFLKAGLIRFQNFKNSMNFKAGKRLGLNDNTQGVNGIKEERQRQSNENKYAEDEQRESRQGSLGEAIGKKGEIPGDNGIQETTHCVKVDKS